MSPVAPGPSELVQAASAGRSFERRMRPGVADVVGDGVEGRARLDAIARWVQDVAYLDLVDAGFEGRGAWVVRRMRIRVASFPRFGEEVALRTFCSGLGRFCAERRTSLLGGAAGVETVALWVCLDPRTRRPMRLEQDFVDAYAESAAGRSANFRLRHPEPPAGAARGRWTFRATDLDIAGHVNNSAYWGPLEEDLLTGSPPPTLDAEIEFRAPAQTGEALVLRDTAALWLASRDEALHASILRW